MALARGKHFIWINAALRSSSFRPGRELPKQLLKLQCWVGFQTHLKAGDLRAARTRRGRSLRAEEEGSTPGWLMHCTWQCFSNQTHILGNHLSASATTFEQSDNRIFHSFLKCFISSMGLFHSHQFPSFNRIDANIDESFSSISEAWVQGPGVGGFQVIGKWILTIKVIILG